MNAFTKLVVVAAMAFSATGCAMAQGGNGSLTGTIYSGYKMGGYVGPAQGTKTGEACAMSILGVVAVGDASLAAAKAAGGVTQVAHVDHDNFSVLGVYAKTCTVVVGQ